MMTIRSILAGLAVASLGFTTAHAVPPDDSILHRGGPGAITGRYLVQFKDSAVQQQDVDPTAERLSRKYSGRILHTYKHALRGFALDLTEDQAEKLAGEPAVLYVEQSRRGYAIDTQNNPPSWSTDRVDQRDLPLNQRYDYPANAGQGATVHVLDSGIRATHQDFTGRVGAGRDFVDNDNDPSDCHGHGTHVAGSAAGTSYGLAKKARVVALRVLNCSGFGSDDDFIAAIDWVKANAVKPAVVNYSIGCQSACSITTLDNAVKGLIASGVQWVQAAGNSNDNACDYSPQKVSEAVTVGNTNQQDGRYVGTGTSSYGPCLDIWAPGTSVVSASHNSDTGSATMTGTSMASPHVAGAAALFLGANPSATPQQVRDALVENSTPNKVTNAGTGSPTNLLYTGFIQPGTGPVVANPGNQTSTAGTPVTLNNTASGGTPPYTWSATGLPTGLSINASTGTISGAPTTAGSSSVTVTATDSASKSGSTTFSWTVNPTGGGGDLVNGGFETGSLSGWTAGGTGNSASVVSTGAHGGSYAAQLGTTTATNGESTISQTFTAGSQLSFWYSMTCPDTVTYAWAKATLRDNTSGTTTTPLAETCTNGQGWKQVTTPLTAGHSYTLTLVNRDDNHPNDPVHTLYDDVTTNGGTGEPNFDLAANPQALSLQPGQSGTSTISTTVTTPPALRTALRTARPRSPSPGTAPRSTRPPSR